MNDRFWKWFAWIGSGVVALVILWALLSGQPASAADLGGNCCSDLEERIADLEAMTVRKGNSKVKVTLYGQVSESILYVEGGDEKDVYVISNSAAESFVGVGGIAVIQPNLRAGFVAEIGVGGYEYGLATEDNTHEIYLRQANIFLERDWGGGVVSRVTVGHLKQATDEIAEKTVVNTALVARLGSLRPLNGPDVGDVLDLYDGTRVDGARGDLVIGGFRAAASWSSGSYYPTGNDSDIWDVALSYAGEGGGFVYVVGIGYRDGIAIPTIGDVPQVDVVSGSASIKHIASGLFVNGMVGNASVDGLGVDDVLTWHAQAGIERKLLTPLGATTIFAEYGEVDDDKLLTIWGGGVVQAFDAAAFDVFVNVRRLEFDFGGPASEEDATVGMTGARIRF